MAAVKLRREAWMPKFKALDSLRRATSAFNSFEDSGRVTSVLLHLQHAFEMLLKRRADPLDANRRLPRGPVRVQFPQTGAGSRVGSVAGISVDMSGRRAFTRLVRSDVRELVAQATPEEETVGSFA
jgi:hypothetical protein